MVSLRGSLCRRTFKLRSRDEKETCASKAWKNVLERGSYLWHDITAERRDVQRWCEKRDEGELGKEAHGEVGEASNPIEFCSKVDSKSSKEVKHKCDLIWFIGQENHSEFCDENALETDRNKNRETVLELPECSRLKTMLAYILTAAGEYGGKQEQS